MIVPAVDFEERFDASWDDGTLFSGGISSGWSEPGESKPIGFRMPDPQPDPSWMLLP